MTSALKIRRIAAFLFILFAWTASSAVDAFATHLRGTTISWSPTGVVRQVKFTIKYAQAGNLALGTAVSVPFNFGDGTTGNIPTVVTSSNATENWFLSEGSIVHTYPTDGPYIAFYSVCCRISTIKLGHDQNMQMETLVTPGKTNNSPVASVPPVFTVPLQPVTGFVISASDLERDPLTFRLATTLEAYGSAPNSAIGNPPGLSINNAGQVTWNTGAIAAAGFAPPVNGDLWTVQFMVEDRDANNAVKSKVPIDIILKFVTATGAPPTLTINPPGPLSVQAGTPITLTITGNDSDPNARVTLNATGLPVGATAGNLNALLIPPVVSTFNWTPTPAQSGSTVISFTATDDTFQQALKSISIFVENNLPPTISCPSSITVPANQFGTIQASVSDPNSEALTVTWKIGAGPIVQTNNIPGIAGSTNVPFSWNFGAVGNYVVNATVTDPKNASASCATSVNVIKGNQTISFSQPTNHTYGEIPFELNANATSGLPVSFTLVSGPVSLAGNMVTINGVSPVTIRASQAGDGNWNAAPDVERTFNIMMAPSVVTVNAVPNPSTFGQAVTLQANVHGVLTGPTGTITLQLGGMPLSPPLPITQYSSPTVGFVTFVANDLAVGSFNVTANYNGDSLFGPSSASTTVVVNPPPAPPFSLTPPSPAGACICTPLVMNTNVNGLEEWFVKADASGILGVTVIAQAVNPFEGETVKATVFDSLGNVKLGPLTASYGPPGTLPFDARDFGSVLTVPGEVYRVEVSTPGASPTQPHYRLKFDGATTAGIPSPSFASFEEDPVRWLFNVGAGEDLNVRVFSSGVPLDPGHSPEVLEYRLIDPSGNVGPLQTLTASVPPALDQTITVPNAAPGTWGLMVHEINQHYRLSKVDGADTGIYLSWLSSGEGSIHGSITAGGNPFLGPVTVNLLGDDGDVIDTLVTTTGAYAFHKVGVGPVRVEIVPPAGFQASPSILDRDIICEKDAVADFTLTAPTTVTVSPASGTFGDSATLEARLTSAVDGTPLSGKSLTFTLPNGVVVTAPPTDASGNTSVSASLLGLNAVTYTNGVSVSFAGDSVYQPSTGAADLIVLRRTVSVTADPKSKTYGDADPALTYSITTGALVGTDNFSGSLTRTAGENVGSYGILQGDLALSNNYTLSYNGANLVIGQRAASVTPNAAGKAYGTADPAFTGTLAGFLDADSVTASYSRTTGETAGPYVISATLNSAANPAAVLANYAIAYNTAPFTISSTLMVSLNGTGTGTVIGPGINCGPDCTETYSVTSPLILVATPAPGSVFLGWVGDCSGIGACNLTSATNHTVGATFATVSTTGRMTGGGSTFMANGTRVTHGMTVQCSTTAKPLNLEINWDKGNNFKLDTLTFVLCYDDAAIGPQPPQAGFDTMVGHGTGRLNGQAATIEFVFTDAGEPGVNDTESLVITQGSNVIVVPAGSRLDKGNHQAHKN